MKALTVKQPYAYLICKGIKDVENRTWKTNFRGRILIHAGAKPFKIETALPNEATVDEIEMISTLNYCEENDLFSAIIGSVEIVDCVKGHQSIWAIKDSERKSYCHWVLANPVIFENPVLNVKGRLSFWESGYDEITCPECGSRQLHNFVDGGISHRCEFCENYILEGEF